jgi:transcriptional regulator NrdR family protein
VGQASIRSNLLDKKLYLGQSLGMESGGGTQLWCPKCDAIQTCKVLWYDNTSKGNFIDTDFPDLHYRERPRECNKCGEHFNTFEINSDAIDELKELRKLVEGIKQSVEDQQKAPTRIHKIIQSYKND